MNLKSSFLSVKEPNTMCRFVKCLRSFSEVLILAGILVFPSVVLAETTPAQTQNRLLSIVPEGSGDAISVKLVTEKPLGYRYTVYDSFDPVRIVIDLPTTDISAVIPQQVLGEGLLKEIRVSKFDVKSGSLGRVELLLAAAAEYKVSVEDAELRVLFNGVKGAGKAPAEAVAQEAATAPPLAEAAMATDVAVDSVHGAGVTAPAAVTEAAAPPVDAAAEVAPATIPTTPSAPAKKLVQVEVADGTVMLKMDGAPGTIKQFTLKSPTRLVVDMFGIKPALKERSFKSENGFDRVRLGVYPDKVRVVLDASKGKMPKYIVEPVSSAVRVSWGERAVSQFAAAIVPVVPAETAEQTPVMTPAAEMAAFKPSGAQVAIEGVDFKVEGSKSILLVALSEPGEATDPVVEGDILRFEVRNARITQNLKRVIDVSAFPSVVRQITPYVFQEKKKQNVRFSVQVKGAVPYEFKREGKLLALSLENGAYAEEVPAGVETLTMPVPEPVTPSPELAEASAEAQSTHPAPPGMPAEAQLTSAAVGTAGAVVPAEVKAAQRDTSVKNYIGQKVTLEFDNADIRNIIQLIAEVSELNIVVSDDVKGTITLRLINVPWDQALDLILETKGLGMLQEGNVVRVMSQKEIQILKLEKLKNYVAIEDNEPAVTKVFVVRYAPIADIATKIQAHLGKSGDSGNNSVTSDPRTRQIIVTARPSRLVQIEEELLKRLDVPERQVMIEARIVEANSSFGNDLGVKWGLSYNDPNGDIPQGGLEAGGSGAFMTLPKTAGVVSGAAGLAGGITFGNLLTNTTILDLRISALETSGNGKVVSTPRITTLNGGQASISQGTKIPYQSSGTDGPKTEFVDANLELKVTPVINPDNTIILDITATNSNIGGFVPTGLGDAPSVNTKEAKTRVLVKNGETTVIGGIFVENETDGESGVPILMNIPILGYLFKSKNITKSRSELLIFITPRIID